MPELLGNLDAVKKGIADHGLDALVAISPENVPYTAGVIVTTQRVLRDRLAIVVMPSEGEATFLVAGQEVGYVTGRTWIEDVRSYLALDGPVEGPPVQGASPIQALVDVLKEKGLTAGRVGIEINYLTVPFHRELVEALPELELAPCEGLLERARMIKTPAELELMTRAAVATERALMAAYMTIQPGARERGIVGHLAGNLLQAGADMPGGLFLRVGPNTGYAHPLAEDYVAQPGDLATSDVGASFSGYVSDVARTAVIGKASDHQRSIYDRLVEVHRRTIEAMAPGVPASEVFQAAVREYDRVKIPFPMAFAGHGIGLHVHEKPLLSAHEHTPLQPGMVFAVETRVRWPEKEGYHIEDFVIISEEGPEVITTVMDTSRLMEI